MLNLRKYIDLKSEQKITASNYCKTHKGEFTVLVLSDNSMLLNRRLSETNDMKTKIFKLFAHQKVCCVKFSHFGLMLNILTSGGYFLRIPTEVMFIENNIKYWNQFIATSDPGDFMSKIRAEKSGDNKYVFRKNTFGMIGDFLGLKREISVDTSKILTNKLLNFEDIELIEIKLSNLKDPEGFSNVININKSEMKKKGKEVKDCYSYFSDFEIWTTFDRKEYIIVSSLSGGLFFISQGKQELVFCFEFGLSNLKFIRTIESLRLMLENDLGDYLVMTLERRVETEDGQNIIKNPADKVHEIEYAPFTTGSSVMINSPDNKLTEHIYEYAQSLNQFRIFDGMMNLKEAYYIAYQNVALIVAWGMFFIIVYQKATKAHFVLLSRESLRPVNTREANSSNQIKSLKYFRKTFEDDNDAVLEGCFEDKDNIREIKLISHQDGQKTEGDLHFFLCTTDSFYFVNTNIEYVLGEFEKKFLNGKITKKDYVLFDSISKTYTANNTVSHDDLKDRLIQSNLHQIAFDFDMHELLRDYHKEKPSSLSYREIIQRYIEASENKEILRNVIQFISEVILTESPISVDDFCYYLGCFLFCCWRDTASITFDIFTSKSNFLKLVNIIIPGKAQSLNKYFIPIALYLSYYIRRRISQDEIFAKFYPEILQEIEESGEMDIIFQQRVNDLLKSIVLGQQEIMTKENRLSLMIMKENSSKKNWMSICSELAFLEPKSLEKILGILLINLRALEKENYEFSYDCFYDDWGLEVFFNQNNPEGFNLIKDVIKYLKGSIPVVTTNFPELMVEKIEGFVKSNLIYSHYAGIFNHITYLLVIVIMLKNKSENENLASIYQKCFAKSVKILKEHKINTDSSLEFACINLNELELFSILSE